MSQLVETPTKSVRVDAAIGAYLRVKFTSTAGQVTVAGSTDAGAGITETATFAADDPVAIRLKTAQGTRKATASEAITRGNPVYAASAGKVAASGTIIEGIALESASGSGSVIEIMPTSNNDISASVGGTTAAAFLVDSDATTPKIELAAQSGGTGDYKATIKPPATLTGNRVFTLPNDANATLDSNYTFTATPAAAESAGNAIPVGCHQVNVTTVTNDANDWIRLPAIASLNIGESIRICCNAGTNFELRTVASSNTTINGQDSDGTKEYLCTDTDVVIVTKATATGFVAQSLTSLGAVRTAVVPD